MVAPLVAAPDGVLIVDETGWTKKPKSVHGRFRISSLAEPTTAPWSAASLLAADERGSRCYRPVAR
jgi:hypothetical protein